MELEDKLIFKHGLSLTGIIIMFLTIWLAFISFPINYYISFASGLAIVVFSYSIPQGFGEEDV